MERHLREWQKAALSAWEANSFRGIVGAVTGGGKTYFALSCIAYRKPDTVLIAVPTIALLDQWWEEVATFFRIRLDDVNILGAKSPIVAGTINIGVLNSLAKQDLVSAPKDLMLIVDECHKAASPQFAKILQLEAAASLGLSATPERPYDDGLAEILVPALGSVIFQYGYKEALADGVIVPFTLVNLVFDLEEECRDRYDSATKAIARSISQNGAEADETVAQYLRRARILNSSERRVRIALQLVASHPGRQIIVFHEDVQSCNVIGEVLSLSGRSAAVYHSGVPLRQRAEILSQFRKGEISCLVTCRALDEGFNVPEAEVGIVAASTATRRQRIQRMGRVLRPSSEKEGAIVYTLVATDPEIARLKDEEAELQDVAAVSWRKA